MILDIQTFARIGHRNEMITRAVVSFLFFSAVIAPSPSQAEWTYIGANNNGSRYWIDFSTIRKHDGNTYWWDMVSYLKPNKYGTFSSQTYFEADCQSFKFKILSDKNFTGPEGTGTFEIYNVPDKEWRYASPGSAFRFQLDLVCKE